MIVVLTKYHKLAGDLTRELAKKKATYDHVDISSETYLDRLYQPKIAAVVIDAELPGLPAGVCADLLNGLGRRIPVVVLGNKKHAEDVGDVHAKLRAELSDAVTVIHKPTAAKIISTLDICGVLGISNRKSSQKSVAYFNPHVPTKMLMENGGLAVLTIDASNFRKIEVEYGNEVYLKCKEVFQNLLNEMWGQPGCFRSSDVLCRRSDHGNQYYVFLNRSRTTGCLPLPGVLENIADRLHRIIQNALWTELSAPAENRRLPACIKNMPTVVVGFASAMYNPCLDPHEIISTAIDSSTRVAQIQSIRMRDRHREMMNTLIQGENLLYPNYQAVFRLANLKKADIEKARKEQSISPLYDSLYGFEALIRVRSDEVNALMGTARAILDPKFMRPDVLFEIAKSTKVALELDQACLSLAINHAEALPGFLMVNILPRNLYFIDHLRSLINGRRDVILEVSESESINNLELVHEVRQQVKNHNIRIAADDFGKAFAGLDRVIEMQPHLIKFDRSLIQNIHNDPVKHAYVQGLVEAARLLETDVLAEGVEELEELICLQAMGIDFVQGFLLHKPQPVEVILGQIQKSNLVDDEQVA